jgi:hypothetical protein
MSLNPYDDDSREYEWWEAVYEEYEEQEGAMV